MALKDDVHTNRGQLTSSYNAQKGQVGRKASLVGVWNSFLSSEVPAMKTTAINESDDHASVLLNTLEREMAEAKDDLNNNPNDWDDNKMHDCQKRWLHLLLGINPYTTDPTQWEPITLD